MVEKKSAIKLRPKEHDFRDRFRDDPESREITEIFSPVTTGLTENDNKIHWMDQYTNAHRIAEENIKFMRIWLLKIPFADLLNEVKLNYVGRKCSFRTDHDRSRIQEFVDLAIQQRHTRYLIQAYTANTAFYKQLNEDLAKRGPTYRFESKVSDRSHDDQVPTDLGEYVFTACLIHHPTTNVYYRSYPCAYRGMNLTQLELQQYVPGARVLTHSFLSTSRCAQVACVYLDFISGQKIPVLCVYRITESKTALDISSLSDFEDEQELLIRPFAAFYVERVDVASFEYEGVEKVTQIFLNEIPSTTERWETSDPQPKKHSLADLYDAQGRLISIEANYSRSMNNHVPSFGESQQEAETSALTSVSSWIEKINKMIEKVLPILSRNEDAISSQSRHFKSIKYLSTKYCLAEYETLMSTLLKQLYRIISTIKQLLEEKENGKDYDANYLNILFVRVQQRATNIDYGIHFRQDQPLIMKQLSYEVVLDERRDHSRIPELLITLNERFAASCLSYVQKCIDLHSQIRIMGINEENVEQLATQLNLAPLTTVEKENWSKKCKPLVIPLQSFISCTSARSDAPYHINQLSLMENERRSLTDSTNQSNLDNDSRDLYRLMAETPFLPSAEFQSSSSVMDKPEFIDDVFGIIDKYRWIVFLGDPGSAKTTLARWLTLLCAKKFMENRNNNNLPARLPVLVRVGEIASALDRDSSLSLIDCLCQPIWFGSSLIKLDNNEQFIREYIKHGHALIILDGLDEIPNFRQRQHIVRLIEQFLQEWTVCPVTLIAPFDDTVLSDNVHPLSCSTVGNQVIITSRIVGYYLCPIASVRIPHYILAPLTLTKMTSFVDHWFMSVYSSLEISALKSNRALSRVCALGEELKSMLSDNKGLQKLTSNPMMLGVLCTLTMLQSNEEMIRLRKQRICLLDIMSKFTLKSCLPLSDREEVLLHFLMDIAVFLHEHSPSGLIEELDMKNILRKSVDNKEDFVHDFIHLVNSETCLFIPRGLCVYGFSHLMFEEYYVCLRILRLGENNLEHERWKSVANQFHYYAISGPRFSEPLVLALSYISWQWSEAEFSSFCNCLLNEKGANRFSDLVPLGAICLLSSICDLVHLPSTEILCTMLNQCIQAGTRNNWLENFPTFVELLKTAMNELPLSFVHEWFLSAPENAMEVIGQIILQMSTLPIWFNQSICHHMWNQLMLTNYRLNCCLLPLISGVDKTFLPENELCQYMITNAIQVERIHPLILAVIICLCGGLNKSETAENIIVFSPECMHRHSEYSSLLTQYLYSNPQALLDYCHQELSSNASHPSVDLLLMCCCLEGCRDELLTLPLIQRLQQLSSYVCSIYLMEFTPISYRPNTKQILMLLEPLINCTEQDASLYSYASIIIVALSRLFSVREEVFSNINFPYKLCPLDEEQLNSELFFLSRSFQPDLIPGIFRRLLSSQHLSTTHRAFLSAAYIMELSIDAYERWCILPKLIFTEDSIQETLTLEVARWIDTQIQIADARECRRLSQALYKCKTFVDVNTAEILVQWLSYNNNSNLYEFAYHAALLLFNINPSATILCCQLLGSELDDFRRRSEEVFKTTVVSSWRLGEKGLKSVVQICRNLTLSAASHIIESFDNIQIRLEHIDSLNILYTLLENMQNDDILKSFSFIFDPSVQSHFINKLEKYHAATEDSISTILRIFSRTKGKWNKFEVNRGITITARLLRKYTSSIIVTSAVLTVFIRWKSYNYIKHIILQTGYPESTRILAIRWFCKKERIKKRLRLLRRLTLESSASIVDVILEGIIWIESTRLTDGGEEPTAEFLVEYCSDDYVRLFRTLIASHADNVDSLRSVYGVSDKILQELYTAGKVEDMDTVLAYTVCNGLMNTQNNPFSTLYDTHLAFTLQYIERREIEFFRAVQNSILGEQGFKKALCTMGKTKGSRRRLAALNLLVYYGELTIEVAEILFDLTLEEFTDQQYACGLIWRLRRVPNRQVNEYLLDKLKNISLQQRYMAAILLVQLAVNDQVSINTVCVHIRNAINDPASAIDVYLTSEFFTSDYFSRYKTHRKGRLDQALATILLQVSFIAGKSHIKEYSRYTFCRYLYNNYDFLFEKIRQASRLITYRRMSLPVERRTDYQSDEDDHDGETTEFFRTNNFFDCDSELSNLLD